MTVVEKGPLPFIYTEEDLDKFVTIDLGHHPYEIACLYLDCEKEVLIIDHLKGLTLFMYKLPNVSEKYSGSGVGSTHKLCLTGNDTYLKLTYEFNNAPGQLIIKNSKGKKLFSTVKGITQKPEIIKIPIPEALKDSEFILEVQGKDQQLEWKVEASVY
jgi:hypothetical protein